MSVEEQRRKAFDLWASREFGEEGVAARSDYDQERYRDKDINDAWCAWNAALDSVVIELPEVFQIDVGMIDSVGFFEEEAVLDAIKAAGLNGVAA